MAGSLFPLMRRVPQVLHGTPARWMAADLGAGLHLLASFNRVPSAGAERPQNDPARVSSRSATTGCRAVAAAGGGCVGLDVETLARIALNVAVEDDWLSPDERTLVRRAANPVLELACHWVLKEAFGKALGVGLALPLAELPFVAQGGAIVLVGAVADVPAEGWTFVLVRCGDTLFGIARHPHHTAKPFAPAGRKPPTPLPDR